MKIENKAELYYGDYLVAEVDIIDVNFEQYIVPGIHRETNYSTGYLKIHEINNLDVLSPLNCSLKLVIRRPDNTIVLYDYVHLLPDNKKTKDILKNYDYKNTIDFRFCIDRDYKDNFIGESILRSKPMTTDFFEEHKNCPYFTGVDDNCIHWQCGRYNNRACGNDCDYNSPKWYRRLWFNISVDIEMWYYEVFLTKLRKIKEKFNDNKL